MEIPTAFYGLYRDVKRRTSEIVTQVCKGRDWMLLTEAQGFLDTTSTPGHLILEGPSRQLGGEPHFHIWLLWAQLLEKEDCIGADAIEAIFEQSLTMAWSTMGLVATANLCWMIPLHRQGPFLQAVHQHWSTFTSVGLRYTNGARQGTDLWSLHTNVRYVLVSQGAPWDKLEAPLPSGGIAELMAQPQEPLRPFA